VYDVQRLSSLSNIAWYNKEFNAIMKEAKRKSIPSILVGNKVSSNVIM